MYCQTILGYLWFSIKFGKSKIWRGPRIILWSEEGRVYHLVLLVQLICLRISLVIYGAALPQVYYFWRDFSLPLIDLSLLLIASRCRWTGENIHCLLMFTLKPIIVHCVLHAAILHCSQAVSAKTSTIGFFQHSFHWWSKSSACPSCNFFKIH